jgi:hypothetical protein
MSENLGISPETTITGAVPIVLGQTHLGDQAASTAKQHLTAAFGEARLRSSQPLPAADLIDQALMSGHTACRRR